MENMCSICGAEMEPWPNSGGGYGNNAQPLTEGRCCDWCNANLVVPARIRIFSVRRKIEANHDQ